jgi:uncharacterized protein DUF6931
MSAGAMIKVKAKAAEICKQFELKEEARPLLRDGLSPREFADALLVDRQYQAAIQFIAHALPHREAIWWGCLCLEHVNREKWLPAEKAACKAAVQWVLDPSAENREAVKAPGEAASAGSPAGLLAMATTWTGGSLAPSNLPAVPPGPDLPARGVAGAIALAAVKGDPLQIADTQRRFVELGIGVAEGRVVWPEIKPKK